MNKSVLAKVFVCALFFVGALYSYVQQQNDLTYLRIELPSLTEEVKLLQEENLRLAIQIDQFENPKHLMQLAKRPEFSHLKHPVLDEILVLEERAPVIEKEHPFEQDRQVQTLFGMPNVVIGAR